MNELMLLAENFKVSVLAGVNLGWQGIGGIILFLTGIGLIYFGIKALKGYRFFPEQEYNIPEEDHYEPTQAKALQKIKTTMPEFNGGEDRVFTEWKIGYTIDGEKYTQIVTDNGYEKGDMIDIKYNPANPQEFYLDDEKSKVEVTEEEKEAEEKEEKTPFGYAAIAIGVLLGVFGVVMLIDKL